MKHIVLLAALLAPYCASASATNSFEFDIPDQAKNRAAKDLVDKAADPTASKADVSVSKPAQVNVANELSTKQRVSVVIPVAPVKPALPLPAIVGNSTNPASTVVPLTPASADTPKPAAPVLAKVPGAAAKVAVPAVAASAVVAPITGKEIYRPEEVSKNKTVPKQVAKAGKLCSPTTIAMTFHNVPTQKGPYFHRWVSLGCQADEVNFVREGNEQYSMNWQLSYVPADEHETARYALRWMVKGKDNKGTPVDYEARHTFNLNNARTLSLTNNMAVSLRKVP